jgi:hypothetical protein
MDVTTQDGVVHPFYAPNTRTRVLKRPRADLEFSQNTGACDREVAARYRDHVPKN